MAQLYEGKWLDTAPAAEEIGADGRFRRIESPLRDTISPDPGAEFPAEAGRYHLWTAWVCPWAARTLAVRVLKGLEDVISVSYARPGLPKEGWVFDEGPDGPVEGGYPLHRLYVEHDPSFTGKVTVPTLWEENPADRQQRELGDHPHPQFGVRSPDRQSPRPLPGSAAALDRPLERPDLPGAQQRRLPRRLRDHAGGLRGGGVAGLSDARCDGGAVDAEPLPLR